MLEKRFIELLNRYKEQMKILKPQPNTIKRLQYISQCIDHLENEIDDLNLDSDKPEVGIYEKTQKLFGPFILQFIASQLETP